MVVWSGVFWGVLVSAGLAAGDTEQQKYLGPCEVAASRDGKTFYGDMVEFFEPELSSLRKHQRKVVRRSQALSKKVRAIKWNSSEYSPGL